MVMIIFIYSLFSIFFFFFFQAEDGIRDTSVTGVQTCALPILAGRSRGPPVSRGRLRVRRATISCVESSLTRAAASSIASGRPSSRAHIAATRSEERRVGKECRCRWARYHEKKKRSRQ